MSHDVVDYPNPDVFNPERFLTADGQIDTQVRDPDTYVFGFGRRCVLVFRFIRMFVEVHASFFRICAGRYFAKQSLFLTISSVLSAFNIRPACDENGSPVELHLSDIMPEDGLFLYGPPILFVCEADH